MGGSYDNGAAGNVEQKAKTQGNGGDDEGLHLARFQSWGP